ncbi:MAG: YdeI/OmpD-associated family protein [Saprospiraceae bacterium]|nr:YdeI/OmpD-associated family protein [Saprospiraceae bacterium]
MKELTFTSLIYQLDYLLNVHYIRVEPAHIAHFGGTLKKRFTCTINDQETFPCGLVALSEGAAYITVNLSRIKKLKLKVNDTVKVHLMEVDSALGLELPEELSELLSIDPKAKLHFEALVLGKQRFIINEINKYKLSATRIEKTIFYMDNIKRQPLGKATHRHILGIDV